MYFCNLPGRHSGMRIVLTQRLVVCYTVDAPITYNMMLRDWARDFPAFEYYLLYSAIYVFHAC
jgi:hypothetical protein